MEEIKTQSGRWYSYFIFFALSILTSNLCHAQSKPFFSHGRFIMAIGTGAAITSDFGNSQNFPAADPNTDEFYNYKTNSTYQTRALIDIFLGKEWMLASPWLMQLGLDINQIQVLQTKGVLLQGMDITSADQYSYRYSLLSRQLLAEGKLLYQYKNQIYPYFILGVGVALNNAYNYSVDVPPFTTFTRIYNNKIENSFSYRIGFGIDKAIDQNWRIGISYRLTDLGYVALGPAAINGISVNGTLNQNHLYISEIVAQLTWLI